MSYIIENDYLSVTVASLGAELMSIKNKKDDSEYLWQGDSKYWGGRAPIMFPICGRLYEGKYTYLGKEYTMPNHGIARGSEFSLKSASKEQLTLSLISNEETKKSYPFDFTFDVTFELIKSTLKITYTVKNNDTKELIFAVGGHPAFNVPINNEGDFEDYYVEFASKSNALRVDFSPTCFCTKNDKLFNEEGTKRIDLKHSLFDDDAIFLYNIDKKIKLASDISNRSVTLKYDRMKYVGLWHAPKTDAPYICIEPWSSIPANEGVVDDLLTKEEMNKLPAGYTYKNSYTITIE
jgi:galactose mutarotase-like enzyme